MSHLYRPTDTEVWPENWATWLVFWRVRTQWRTGMGGAVGLDYGAVYPLLDRLELAPDDWLSTLDDLTAMENAALAQIHRHDSEN